MKRRTMYMKLNVPKEGSRTFPEIPNLQEGQTKEVGEWLVSLPLADRLFADWGDNSSTLAKIDFLKAGALLDGGWKCKYYWQYDKNYWRAVISIEDIK